MYVAVKGGEAAIGNAHELLADRRRGARDVPELETAQINEQLALAVARVMAEASLYDERLAALAIKQSRGDMIEAIFLLRAYRNTLSRWAYTRPVDTESMQIERRISATFKDLPGGQVLGPTFDYTHRLLDFTLESNATVATPPQRPSTRAGATLPGVSSLLMSEQLIEQNRGDGESGEPETDAAAPVPDITREPLDYPLEREARLQSLARADEGYLLGLGYSTQRGYGRNHPFAGEIRMGEVDIELDVPELDFPVVVGRLRVTECQMFNQFKGSATEAPKFTRGYGLVFGHSERKAMSMALVDRALRAREFGEEVRAPAQDEEFVISHGDNVQATGFVEHLKLPHYVDFQAELDLVRTLQKEFHEQQALQVGSAGDDPGFASAGADAVTADASRETGNDNPGAPIAGNENTDELDSQHETGGPA